MGAYVERADCFVILVPGSIHVDRRSYNCYRTFRSRAFCVMEMFAAFLSRRKTHPTLLIRSSRTVPKWISIIDAQTLAVGESSFTCCAKNHEGEFGNCDREIATAVLDRMIAKKTTHLFSSNNTRMFFFICHSFIPAYFTNSSTTITAIARLMLVQREWYVSFLLSQVNTHLHLHTHTHTQVYARITSQ